MIAGMKRTLIQIVRAAKYLFTVRAALPRWLAALVVVGLLPVPGPFDEVVLLLAAAILVIRHRALLRVVWTAAGLDNLATREVVSQAQRA